MTLSFKDDLRMPALGFLLQFNSKILSFLTVPHKSVPI